MIQLRLPGVEFIARRLPASDPDWVHRRSLDDLCSGEMARVLHVYDLQSPDPQWVEGKVHYTHSGWWFLSPKIDIQLDSPKQVQVYAGGEHAL